MFHWHTLISGVLLVSVVGIESMENDASYKNEKNMMLWDMTHYCISRARDIYLDMSKKSESVLTTNEKREKSLPYFERAKQLFSELEKNYLPDESVNDNSIVPFPGPEFSNQKPADCSDILNAGHNESGLYTICPAGKELKAYCDMVTDGGGWTVIQRRGNFSIQEDFYRCWEDYSNGFGNTTRDFWLGNKNIYLLTNQAEYEIRFDLKDIKGVQRHAVYKSFRIDDENCKYTLHIRDYSGNAGDNMAYHNSHPFSTKDSENARCAKERMGGWWYVDCTDTNLNGLYRPGLEGREGMTWYGFHTTTSLAGSEIKIRKKNKINMAPLSLN